MGKVINIKDKIIINTYYDVLSNGIVISYDDGKEIIKKYDEQTVRELVKNLMNQNSYRWNLIKKLDKANGIFKSITIILGVTIIATGLVAGFILSSALIYAIAFVTFMLEMAGSSRITKKRDERISRLVNTNTVEINGLFGEDYIFTGTISTDSEVKREIKKLEEYFERQKQAQQSQKESLTRALPMNNTTKKQAQSNPEERSFYQSQVTNRNQPSKIKVFAKRPKPPKFD